MAHLQPSHVSIPTKLFIESSYGFCWGVRDGKAKRTEIAKSWKPPCGIRRLSAEKICTRIFSAEQELGMLEKVYDDQISNDIDDQISNDIDDLVIDDDNFYLVDEHGWKVRRMRGNDFEMRKVASIQAEAFHVSVALFDDLFFQFFQAEVLAGLLYRLKNSPSDRYACLVAVPESSTSNHQDELVGVVDATVLGDGDVVQHLDGAKQYLYVSGIAVSKTHRRKKVATALLKACERVSALWGYEYLVLRAYEDDRGARALYENAGYRVVSEDPPWLALVGRKRRILMVKQRSSCKVVH
ncbi:hypothetical protein V2J09_013898 [Rumex salicifolius]